MFTQRAFIRKNTPELREYLNELGMVVCGRLNENCIECHILHKDGATCLDNSELSLIKSESIDCGTNERLFLAIAALKDDTDINQWFTDGKTWRVSSWNNASYHLEDWYKYFGYAEFKPHKATVEELKEHFK